MVLGKENAALKFVVCVESMFLRRSVASSKPRSQISNLRQELVWLQNLMR